MENTKRAVVANELVGNEYGKAIPVGETKGVKIPNELQRYKKAEAEKEEKNGKMEDRD